jgi:hypothetical protein
VKRVKKRFGEFGLQGGKQVGVGSEPFMRTLQLSIRMNKNYEIASKTLFTVNVSVRYGTGIRHLLAGICRCEQVPVWIWCTGVDLVYRCGFGVPVTSIL